MIVHFVRHGESEFNAQGRIQGQLDPPLSPLGLRQSTAVAEAMARLDADLVVHSPLRRAVQTAEPIAAAADRTMKPLDELMEIHAGVFQGLAWPEIAERYPAEARRWKNQEPDFRPPGGESRRELMERGLRAFQAIREIGRREIIVVAHGGLLGAALKACLGISASENPFRFNNCGWNTVVWGARMQILKINDIAHLHGVGDGGLGDL